MRWPPRLRCGGSYAPARELRQMGPRRTGTIARPGAAGHCAGRASLTGEAGDPAEARDQYASRAGEAVDALDGDQVVFDYVHHPVRSGAQPVVVAPVEGLW